MERFCSGSPIVRRLLAVLCVTGLLGSTAGCSFDPFDIREPEVGTITELPPPDTMTFDEFMHHMDSAEGVLSLDPSEEP